MIIIKISIVSIIICGIIKQFITNSIREKHKIKTETKELIVYYNINNSSKNQVYRINEIPGFSSNNERNVKSDLEKIWNTKNINILDIERK